ncbi:MAG: YARHG domain-containing protein [Lachnospiraceae bacterium]|nr:YARHG domain-containing protein [Lachnospiraceae bacterium]
MFCNRCGKELKDGTRFCPECGKEIVIRPRQQPPQGQSAEAGAQQTAVPQSAEIGAQQTPAPQGAETATQQAPAAGKTWLPIVIIAAAALIVLGAAAALFLLKPWENIGGQQISAYDDDDDDEEDDDEEDDEEDDKEDDKEDDEDDDNRYKEAPFGISGENTEAVTAEAPAAEAPAAEAPAAEATAAGPDTAVVKDAFLAYAKKKDFVNGCVGYFDSAFEKDEYGNQTPIRDYSRIPYGYIDCLIEDFDGDGQAEMMLPLITEGDAGKLTLVMYEYTGDVKEASQYDAGNCYFSGDYDDTMVMSYDHQGKTSIGIAIQSGAYLMADGEGLDFFEVQYDGKGFSDIGRAGYAGSDGEENEAFMKAMRDCGLEVSWDRCFNSDFHQEVLSVSGGTKLFMVEAAVNDYVRDEEIWQYSRIAGFVRYTGTSPYDFTRHEGPDPAQDYILTESSRRPLTDNDLKNLSREQLRLARNEIVARHGRKFQDEELQAYFDSKGWYRGTIWPDDFDITKRLTETERDNMEFIQKHEK